MTDDVFGPYRLVSLLGRGGMGEVWRAYDIRKEREVALKVLPAWMLGDEGVAARFRQEASRAAKLSNLHIVPIHDYGEIDGRLFIDMQLLADAVDLGVLLERDGALPPTRAVDLVAQAARGLDAAHRAGLVHRDVKPANILVVDDAGHDHAYVIDFGIARAADSTGRTIPGTVIGTPAYMAPERFEGRGDQRSDVYALGCVLHEALTGRPAFVAHELLAYWRLHDAAPPPRASQMRPEVPQGLDNVIARALAKDPGERFPGAVEMASAARDVVAAEVRRRADAAEAARRKREDEERAAEVRRQAERAAEVRRQAERAAEVRRQAERAAEVRRQAEHAAGTGSRRAPADARSATTLDRPLSVVRALRAGRSGRRLLPIVSGGIVVVVLLAVAFVLGEVVQPPATGGSAPSSGGATSSVAPTSPAATSPPQSRTAMLLSPGLSCSPNPVYKATDISKDETIEVPTADEALHCVKPFVVVKHYESEATATAALHVGGGAGGYAALYSSTRPGSCRDGVGRHENYSDEKASGEFVCLRYPAVSNAQEFSWTAPPRQVVVSCLPQPSDVGPDVTADISYADALEVCTTFRKGMWR